MFKHPLKEIVEAYLASLSVPFDSVLSDDGLILQYSFRTLAMSSMVIRLQVYQEENGSKSYWFDVEAAIGHVPQVQAADVIVRASHFLYRANYPFRPVPTPLDAEGSYLLLAHYRSEAFLIVPERGSEIIDAGIRLVEHLRGELGIEYTWTHLSA